MPHVGTEVAGDARKRARQQAGLGLPHPSVVNITQLLVVDRTRLRDHAGTLPGAKMKEVDEGLRLVLGL
jgi:mRNA-degrading endonuclease toxin of MazEF toxin-antitoxin module